MKSKILSLALAATLLLAACGAKKDHDDISVDIIKNPNSAQGYDNKAKMPVMTFDSELHDFGRLSAGENISYSFHFRNTGNADLVISSTSATCGCTVADYPKGRIAPGADGYVTVTFNRQVRPAIPGSDRREQRPARPQQTENHRPSRPLKE